MNQQTVTGKRRQDRTRRRTLFFVSRVRWHALTIQTLQQKIQHQHRQHQKHQRLHTLRGVQVHGPDRQRAFEVPVDVLAVVLLLELRKQRIGAALVLWNGGHDHRVAVVLLVLLQRLRIEREFKAMRRLAAATAISRYPAAGTTGVEKTS